MEPKATDIAGAGLLFLVLAALVVLIVLAGVPS